MCYILVGLPLLLWPLAGWSSPVLAVLISFLLLGVENIGAFIEEPFHVSLLTSLFIETWLTEQQQQQQLLLWQ
jgi:hypothetical protein